MEFARSHCAGASSRNELAGDRWTDAAARKPKVSGASGAGKSGELEANF